MQKVLRASFILSINVLSLAIASIASAAPEGLWESVAHAVRYYNTATTCSCTGLDNKKCTEPQIWETFATTFQNRMSSTFGYTQNERFTNTAVDARDFVDPALRAWGEDTSDPYGTDFADVIFYAGHSNHKCNSSDGYRYQFAMGDSSGDCWLRTDQHLRWGNDDADVAILFSCESVQYCVWSQGGYYGMATGQLNTILGFHGTMYLSSDTNSRLNGYLAGTKDQGIGDDWIDEMTDINSGSNDDVCGTVVIFGGSMSSINDQFYNGGFRDFNHSSGQSMSAFYGIIGCDPSEGEPLNLNPL